MRHFLASLIALAVLTVQVAAGGFLIDPYRFASAPPAVATFRGQTNDNVDRSSYTFAGEAIGTASADRIVVVAACTFNVSATWTSVSIAGTNGTQAIANSAAAGTCAIYYRLVTTGTTATIVVTMSTTVGACNIYVYTITGAQSATPTDTAVATDADPTGTIDVQAGGTLIATANTAATTTTSWTGVTEDDDLDVGGWTFTAGHLEYAAAVSGQTVEANFGTNSNPKLVAAAWR